MQRIARLTAAALVAGFLAAAAAPAARAEALPPVSFVEVAPVEDDHVVVERVSGGNEADHWRLHLDVWIRNYGTAPLHVSGVKTRYFGGSDPDDALFPVDVTLSAGTTTKIIVPEDRRLPYPLPGLLIVAFEIDGYADRSTAAKLAEYGNTGSGGSYFFFGRGYDLPDGWYWSTNGGNKLTSHHRDVRSQRFAEDMGVVRLDEDGAWTDLHPGADGTANEDYLGFGRPIRAIADGEILRCRKSFTDNVVGEKVDGGGNLYWISHGPGEQTLYAHLQAGSVPDALCPEDGKGGGITVKAGQIIGRMGNSGHSSKPHIHIHTQVCHPDFTEPGCGASDGRSLLYDSIKVIDRSDFDPANPNDGWSWVHGAAPDHPQLIGTAAKRKGAGPVLGGAKEPLRKPGFPNPSDVMLKRGTTPTAPAPGAVAEPAGTTEPAPSAEPLALAGERHAAVENAAPRGAVLGGLLTLLGMTLRRRLLRA